MEHATQLNELCRSARQHLLLVAPFIKVSVLGPLLGEVPTACPVDVVTRWWPWEIAQEVSDLDVWTLFRGREDRRLFLRQDVHAKYYRADDHCLVGSANLTQKALRMVEPANLELMVGLPCSTTGLADFEDELWRAAVLVDENIFLAMRELVEQLPAPPSQFFGHAGKGVSVAKFGEGRGDDLATWVPRTRQPQDLYLAYVGESAQLSQASATAAAADLAVLNVPPGLDCGLFEQAVRTMMLQTPVIAAVDRFVQTERRFGEVAQYVASLTRSSHPDRDWQAILRWLRHFSVDRYRYRRPNYSELIVRRG